MNSPWSGGEDQPRRELSAPVTGGLRNQILMYFTAAIIWTSFGASRLGLLGFGPPVDNSWTSHLIAAGFLIAGGVFIALGAIALRERLSARKSA
jgi:hypothetical protein